MKIALTFTDAAFLKLILDHPSFQKPELARIVYKKYKEAMEMYVNSRNALVWEYEIEVEVDEPLADGKWTQKIKKKEIDQKRTPELREKIEAMKVELDFDWLTYLPIKLAVHNFPNIGVDKETGEKGIKWEGDIGAYVDLKEKFA